MRFALVVVALLISFAASTPGRSGQVEFVQPADRDVTPPGVTPGPPVEGPLVRQPVPPPPPDPPRWHRFFLPETLDAATLRVDKGTIHIADVTAVPRETTCQIAEGGTWPCGRTALYAFRMFLRGRAVECYFAAGEMDGEITVPCRVGQTDLGLWLLSQGWVAVGDDASDEYRAAARDARCANRGLWRKVERESDCPARMSQT